MDTKGRPAHFWTLNNQMLQAEAANEMEMLSLGV